MDPGLLETTRLAADKVHRECSRRGRVLCIEEKREVPKSDFAVYQNLEIAKEKVDVLERLDLPDGGSWI